MVKTPVAKPLCPHLFAVDAGKPFVDVLACHLLDTYGTGTLGLSGALVLVPNRRSVGALRQSLLEHAGGRPMLLPRIQPLRDADLDRIMPEIVHGGDGGLFSMRSIPPKRRTLELARLIGERGRLPGEEAFSTEQNIRLAEALGELLDDLHREEVDFSRFAGLAPDDYARHWQLTLEFLQVVATAWPRRRAELSGIDAGARQNLVLDSLSGYWAANPPAYPVIAAGTTGSIPATARLLATIAGLPTGRVILPGLDREMADDAWERIDPTHPQAGLKRLLNDLGCSPAQVRPLDAARIAGAPEARMRLFAEAMLPAELSANWRESRFDDSALDRLTMVAFEHGDDEACGIALMLRDALEDPAKRAMLVTHDRALARQVTIRLRRYGIDAEDGGGRPLVETRAASFLLAVLAAAEPDAGPVALLGLLKHPLCGLSLARDVRLGATARIEKAHLRGIRPRGGLSALLAAVESGEKDEEARELLRRLLDTLVPLTEALEGNALSLAAMLASLLAVGEVASLLPEEGDAPLLWQQADGKALHRFLADLAHHADGLGAIVPRATAGILRGLLSRETYHPPHDGNPRLSILSPVEARMQHADLVVLAGLNEECWPPAPGSDPWMSRAMRQDAGLAPHDSRVGQSAHDFFSLIAAPEVILTRAEKSGATLRRPSRWWLRLGALLDASGLAAGESGAMRAFSMRSRRWLEWTRVSEAPSPGDVTAGAARPAPCPAPDLRPSRLSVSEVGQLLNDPYLYYARAVLKLRELDPVDKLPDSGDFGDAVHLALKHFFAEGMPALGQQSQHRLADLLTDALARTLRQDALPAFWMQRVRAIAAEILHGEGMRRGPIVRVEVERSISMMLDAGGPFELLGRIDRIDHLVGGGVEITDYKTAGNHSEADVRSGRRPQLPLCGLLAESKGLSVAALNYWFLTRSKAGLRPAASRPGESMAEARQGLERLIVHYRDPVSRYSSRAEEHSRHGALDAYDHLARTGEWR